MARLMPRPGVSGGARPRGVGGYHPGPNQSSPSQNPQGFRRGIQNYFGGLAGQLGGQGGQPGGGRRRRDRPQTDSASGDPNALPPQPDSGPQQFGTYAPDTQAGQFHNENFGKKPLKGLRQLDTGGFGGFGGMGGFGGGGFGATGQDPMAMMQMLMSLMGQFGGQEDQGPIRGKR